MKGFDYNKNDTEDSSDDSDIDVIQQVDNNQNDIHCLTRYLNINSDDEESDKGPIDNENEQSVSADDNKLNDDPQQPLTTNTAASITTSSITTVNQRELSPTADEAKSKNTAPGTGKTYLAKAIAGECNCTFISVSSLDLLLKWLGGSRKTVPYLFELARERQPTILFIHDIDLLYSTRDESEEDKQNRIRFLLQIQDVTTMHHSIILLAATNTPWTLHSSVLRQ
ncbi:unnamed protein product [Didymodactylos carnosus]|uniref:ATPase AAA-type core domain-containing protein n=1 Tax=Didymodactylos carnosus TaxID=1234261 RepID=A0A814PXZ1_9BILA|nr:unnamed protein product [Didymodactylos carnosus]CAF1112047.1 unnamed protein product [Didymodactylos carnosus]CAF3861836.1 unnamed protein product [Didymodactylos carnosus]CAF3876319.1 unnamed protein product [Didymodactylos carnosus]